MVSFQESCYFYPLPLAREIFESPKLVRNGCSVYSDLWAGRVPVKHFHIHINPIHLYGVRFIYFLICLQILIDCFYVSNIVLSIRDAIINNTEIIFVLALIKLTFQRAIQKRIKHNKSLQVLVSPTRDRNKKLM